MKNEGKQLNEEITKIKTPRLNLTPINKHLSSSKRNKTDIVKKVKSRCLIEVLRKSGSALHTSSYEVRSTLIMYLHNILSNEWDFYEDFEKCVKGKIKVFCSTVNKKWKKSNRCMSKFLIKNEKWLQLEFNIPFIAKNEIVCLPSTSRGRPSKSFFDLSEHS
ncbi:hypothetical protein QTP88_019558 [Uroleucon formosanum]